MVAMTTLAQKKEIILRHEQVLANSIGATVFEKPRVSFWMILIPFLFLYFIYRMQRFKLGRMKFDEEFMTARRRVMDVAINAVATDTTPDIDELAYGDRLPEPLQKPYLSWIKALARYYADLLTADGDSFESMVRGAYGNRTGCMRVLNQLDSVEREFYTAIKAHLGTDEGTADIISAIEARSRQLRRELVDRIFVEL